MKTRFNVDDRTIRTDLERTATRLGYKSVELLRPKTGSDGVVRLNGLGNPRLLRCAKFEHWSDNIRAIGLTLEYQRRIKDDYGAEILRASAEVVSDPAGLLPRQSLARAS